MKRFPLSTILSITTGRLFCEIGNVYEILNFITGDNLFTHVLPRSNRFAAPFILAQYPELAAVENEIPRLDALLSDKSPADACREFVASLNLPAEYEIESRADSWLSRDPVQELVGMMPDKTILVTDATATVQKV